MEEQVIKPRGDLGDRPLGVPEPSPGLPASAGRSRQVALLRAAVSGGRARRPAGVAARPRINSGRRQRPLIRTERLRGPTETVDRVALLHVLVSLALSLSLSLSLSRPLCPKGFPFLILSCCFDLCIV